MSASQAERRGFDPRLPLLGQLGSMSMKDEIRAPKTFLIVRTDRLGDVVLTLPMARAIKRAMPEVCVKFLVRSYTEPIIERAPDIDEIMVAGNDSSFRDLIRHFRSSYADIAFFPSPRFQLVLAAFLSRIPIRVGTGYRWYSFLFNQRIYEHRHTAEHHEAEYNLRMLAKAGVSADPNELPNIQLRSKERNMVNEWLKTNLDDSNSKFIVLHATIGGSTHPWPRQNFVELGRKIAQSCGMTIILTGVRQDLAELEEIAEEIGNASAKVFAGRSLLELAALLERAELVIAASTGPGHLAAALGTRTIGLFPLPKPLSKERWGFRGPAVTNLSATPLPECPNCDHCTCMERLDIETVWNKMKTVLDAAVPVSY